MSWMTRADDGRRPKQTRRRPALQSFMALLTDIAPNSGVPISPDSKLMADLEFDSLAFARLAVLLYEHYGVEGLSTASLRSGEDLTVETFFSNCILDVLSTPRKSER
jgi:hypothetical protein